MKLSGCSHLSNDRDFNGPNVESFKGQGNAVFVLLANPQTQLQSSHFQLRHLRRHVSIANPTVDISHQKKIFQTHFKSTI